MATIDDKEVIKRTDEGAVAASPTGENDYDQHQAVVSKGDMETPKPIIGANAGDKPPSPEQTQNPKHPVSDVPEEN